MHAWGGMSTALKVFCLLDKSLRVDCSHVSICMAILVIVLFILKTVPHRTVHIFHWLDFANFDTANANSSSCHHLLHGSHMHVL